MAVSIIHKSPDAFTDATLPKLQRDPLVIDGVLARIDFLDAFCNPHADGALQNGAVFKNMVEGGPDATYSAGIVAMTNAAGKKGLILGGGTASPIGSVSFPAGQFDMHAEGGDRSFVRHFWAKQTAGFPAASVKWFGDRSAETSPIWGATPAQLDLYTSSAGDQPYALRRVGGAVASTTPRQDSGVVTGAAHLFSGAFDAATKTLSYWYDGQQIGTIVDAFGLGTPAMRSHGTLVFSAAPSAGDTVTINGQAITFVASGAVGAQVNVGADAAASAQALKTYVNANKASLAATAEGTGSTINVLARTAGAGAIATITLAEASSSISIGAIVASRPLQFIGSFKGEVYAIAQEDLSVSGRSIAAAIAAEYAGYRPRLVAAGLAS